MLDFGFRSGGGKFAHSSRTGPPRNLEECVMEQLGPSSLSGLLEACLGELRFLCWEGLLFSGANCVAGIL